MDPNQVIERPWHRVITDLQDLFMLETYYVRHRKQYGARISTAHSGGK
jgi:hypothetical protein